MHGGSVEAHSAGPGQGSEFVVRWPLPTRGNPGECRGSSGGAAVTERAVHVLLVDDNVDAAESLAMLLRLWGHEVAVAHDGPAALRAAEGRPGGRPAGHQPAGHGRLRTGPAVALAARPGTIVLVALTGWGQEEDRRRSQEAGFAHHLTKPVDLSALQELLEQFQLQAAGA